MGMNVKNQREQADSRYRETMELAGYCADRMNDFDRALTTDDLYDGNGLPA